MASHSTARTGSAGRPPGAAPGIRPSWATSPATQRSMRSNKRRDTRPELAIRRLLFHAGARYRVDVPLWFDRRRRADIVFPKAKLAVFIDGCFWHGCITHYSAPRANASYWRDKLESNNALCAGRA